jgi:hypothetical protein
MGTNFGDRPLHFMTLKRDRTRDQTITSWALLHNPPPRAPRVPSLVIQLNPISLPPPLHGQPGAESDALPTEQTSLRLYKASDIQRRAELSLSGIQMGTNSAWSPLLGGAGMMSR